MVPTAGGAPARRRGKSQAGGLADAPKAKSSPPCATAGHRSRPGDAGPGAYRTRNAGSAAGAAAPRPGRLAGRGEPSRHPRPMARSALGRAWPNCRQRPAAEALRRAILDPASSGRRRIVAMVLPRSVSGQSLDGKSLLPGSRSRWRPTPSCGSCRRGAPGSPGLPIHHPVQQPPDVQSRLDRLGENGSDPALSALAFFAMDEREAIATTAVECWDGPPAPRCTRCARWRRACLPRAGLVERMQRKLLLSGVPDEPLPSCPLGARV